MATRKGRLEWKHVHAWLNTGREPELKGRVVVDRGAGVLEFPTPAQFVRLARDEGVPSDLVQRAFGHVIPKTAPRRKRRSSRAARPAIRTERAWYDWSPLFDTEM